MSSRLLNPWALLCAALFTVLGLLFVNYAGLQTDEALYAASIFRGDRGSFGFQIAKHPIPLMFFSYLGALKTWIWAPIFKLKFASHLLVRIPALLLAAFTILLSWRLLERIHSRRAAWVGSLLLATDTMYLLTSVFDWGPVVLQHLLMVAAMLLAVRWYQQDAPGSLAAAAFCCGLAMWDKALFLWILGGFILAALLFARALAKKASWRATRLAAAGLVLGALPLIAFNLAPKTRFATLRNNSTFNTNELSSKAALLRVSLSGSLLFGYLVNESSLPMDPKPARAWHEKASYALHAITGEHRANLLQPAMLFAFLLLPMLWRTPARCPLLFLLIVTAVAWLQMGLTVGAGGSAHHAVLLWPLPHFFLAIALAQASMWRHGGELALFGIVALLVASNLLVTNQYFYQLVSNGPHGCWTDAIFRLHDGLVGMKAEQIMLTDWGMTDNLTVLSRGKLPVRVVSYPFQPGAEQFAMPRAVWVQHAPGFEEFPGVNSALRLAAKKEGFIDMTDAVYPDSNGRLVFRVFHFERGNRLSQ